MPLRPRGAGNPEIFLSVEPCLGSVEARRWSSGSQFDESTRLDGKTGGMMLNPSQALADHPSIMSATSRLLMIS